MNNTEDKIIELANSLIQGQKKCQHPNVANDDVWRSQPCKTPYSTVLDTFLQQAKRSATMIANNRPANRYECVEIEALIFYTARENGVNDANLRTQITNDLKIKKLGAITLADYKKIRDYLWDEAKETA